MSILVIQKDLRMRNPHNLSERSQGILEGLTQHYAEILHIKEDALAKERSRQDFHKPWGMAPMIMKMSRGQLDGPEREHLQQLARDAGRNFDDQRVYVPFSAFNRDLLTASGTAGGYLVSGRETHEAVDILRPWSVTARAGVVIETGLVGNQAVPKVTAKATAEWQTLETTAISGSQPTLGEIALLPKTVGVTLDFSRQLARQTNAEKFVQRELLRTAGTAVDQAVINGSGIAGEPLGLMRVPGVQTQSGTTLNSGVLSMKQKAAEANVNDERIAFLSTPAVRALLEARERASGGGKFVWENDRVADRPAYVSTDLPAGVMIAGDFSNVYVGVWGAGLIVEINPHDPQAFKAGIIRARVLVSLDVAVLHPSGFVVASSIT
jgi:HK97 family phage major capsid protein